MPHIPKPLSQSKAQEVAAQFWSKVRRGDPDKCWPWLGTLFAGGYGSFVFGGRPEGAHRIACALSQGDLPLGAHVLHRCDNRACCNPAHLFPGDHAANMRDMHAKGRHGGGKRKTPRPGFSDERFLIAHKGGFLAAMRVDSADSATKQFRRKYRAGGFLLSECASRAEFEAECKKLSPWPSAEQMFLLGIRP